MAVAAGDGRILARMSLPSSPVWDGMAAANGKLYAALTDGRLACLWPVASGRPGTPLSAAGGGGDLPPVKLAPEPGLVGRWRFDEGEGLIGRDCSGKGHDASVADSWGRAAHGGFLRTRGEPDAAVIPDAPDFHVGTGDFTLAFWVAVERYGARLLGKEAFPKNWWVINLPADGRPELVLGTGRGPGATARQKTTQPIPLRRWTHIAAVVDRQARRIRWFIDGAAAGEGIIPPSLTQGLDVSGEDIRIPSTYLPFQGGMSDLRIYRKALDREQVKRVVQENAAWAHEPWSTP